MLRTLISKMSGKVLSMLAVIGGLVGVMSCPAYGSPGPGLPPTPHDPTFRIEDFSYTPASPVTRAARLKFVIEANKPTEVGRMVVEIGFDTVNYIEVNDYGLHPDEMAGDGTWTGERQLRIPDTPGTYSVNAVMYWHDGFTPLVKKGAPLKILEEF